MHTYLLFDPQVLLIIAQYIATYIPLEFMKTYFKISAGCKRPYMNN